MRQADINRVKKAQSHIEAARTLLQNIKWENLSTIEDTCRGNAYDGLKSAEYGLIDMVNCDGHRD